MPIEGIYNPAAVVDTLRGRGSSGGSGTVKQPEPQISSVSRAKAANGEARLSYETQQAIANGALPPTIAQPKEQIQTSEFEDQAKIAQDVIDAVSSVSSTPIQAPSVPISTTLNVGSGVSSGGSSGGSTPSVGSSVDISV